MGAASRNLQVYPILAKHQREEEWAWKDEATLFQTWADRFGVEFNFHLPRVVLSIARLPWNVPARFQEGRNRLGLEGEIAMNAKYLDVLEKWELLGILLHEMLHAWQAFHGIVGKRSHHNQEFCNKARALGLNVNRFGVTGYALESPFKQLLRRFGVAAPDKEVPPMSYTRRGDSKLKKWSCGCPVNVRVAVADFRAVCLDCGEQFVRQ